MPHGVSSMELSPEVFYCKKCNTLERGMDLEEKAIPKQWLMLANCPRCGGKMYKTRPRGEFDIDPGVPEQPSENFWKEFVIAVEAHMVESKMNGNPVEVANVTWFGFMSSEDRLKLLEKFRETGQIDIGGARKNPEDWQSVHVDTLVHAKEPEELDLRGYTDVEIELAIKDITKFTAEREDFFRNLIKNMKGYDTEGWQLLNKDLSEVAKLVGDNAYLLAIRRRTALRKELIARRERSPPTKPTDWA